MAEAKKMEKKTTKKEEVLDDVKKVKKTTSKKIEETSTKKSGSTGIKKTATNSKTKSKTTGSTKKATKADSDKVVKSAAKKKETNKKEQTEKSKMKVEKVPSGVVVKKDDKEVVSKIKLPKVVEEDKKSKTTKTTKKDAKDTKKKETSKKATATKKLNTEKDNKKDIDKKDKKASKEEIEENNKLAIKKEQTIIERIKSFLKKIIEMQKEAKEEIEVVKEGVKVKKEAKAKKLKLEADPEKDITETYLLEYYDLPYRYNETVVRILAQTPRRIFVYWDISNEDREKYIATFGENFFNETYPVLLLYNEDKKYIKEVVINDFANSWYIDIDNPKTKYSVQLGRKFRNKPQIINIAKMVEEKIDLQNDYLPVVNSNKIEAPNDRILFDHFTRNVKFRNVKTGQESVKDLGVFVEKISKAYDAPSFKEIFKEMNPSEAMLDDRFDFDNPTSGNPTSTFK